MHRRPAIRILFAAFAALLLAAEGHCGSLTLCNEADEASYCAAFDLWTFSGPSRQTLTGTPKATAEFKAPPMQAIGKIAVYKLPPGLACDNAPTQPECRHDPGGILLPTRNFIINVQADGQVRILERN